MRVLTPLETYVHLFPLRGNLALAGAQEKRRGPCTVVLNRVPRERPIPLEDYIVALLKYDPRWGRACAARNSSRIRRQRLTRRLREEHLEKTASQWRFEDFGLRLPAARKISRESLRYHENNNALAWRHIWTP